MARLTVADLEARAPADGAGTGPPEDQGRDEHVRHGRRRRAGLRRSRGRAQAPIGRVAGRSHRLRRDVQHGAARGGHAAGPARRHVRRRDARIRPASRGGMRRREATAGGEARAGHRRPGPHRRRAGRRRRRPAAVPHRHAQLRRDRSRGDRRVPRSRRLQGPRQGPLDDDARAGHRGAEGQRPARARRRRLPGLAEVEPDPRVRRARSTSSSATATRAIRARTWTAAFSRATLTPFSRA